MKLVVDSHTHTLVSGHAYSTLNEMILSAKNKGLKAIGITEHAPAMPGSCHEYYFNNYRNLDREALKKKFGIEVLLGVELNIMDEDGTVDLSAASINLLDVVIASIHSPCYNGSTQIPNISKAYVNVLKNPLVDIIGHPDDCRLQPNYDILVPAAKKYGKLLEVNCSSIKPGSFRQGAMENYRCMLKLCKEYQQPVIVNTDAHYEDAIAQFEPALKLFEELDFPEELVVNTSLEKYHSYIHRYKN